MLAAEIAKILNIPTNKVVFAEQQRQDETMKKEDLTFTQVYRNDLDIVEAFMKQQGIKNRRDGIRAVIEYANSHGAFS